MIWHAEDSAQLELGVASLLRDVERLDGVLNQSAVRTQNADLKVAFLCRPATSI